MYQCTVGVEVTGTNLACTGLTSQFGRDTGCYREYGRRRTQWQMLANIYLFFKYSCTQLLADGSGSTGTRYYRYGRVASPMGRGAGKGDGKGGDCSDFSLIGEAGALVQGLCVLIIVFIIGGPVMIGYAITFFGKASTDSRDLLISQLKVKV